MLTKSPAHSLFLTNYDRILHLDELFDRLKLCSKHPTVLYICDALKVMGKSILHNLNDLQLCYSSRAYN